MSDDRTQQTTAAVDPARVLAALETLGWPDDRDKAAHPEVSQPREYWSLVEDTLRAADVAQPTATAGVLAEVRDERARQDAKFGQQDCPDGTGPDVIWSFGGRAEYVADLARAGCQRRFAEGFGTYMDIAMEEIAEAFAESDPVKLRAELIQVSAVFVKWVEALDRRPRGLESPSRAARARVCPDHGYCCPVLPVADRIAPELRLIQYWVNRQRTAPSPWQRRAAATGGGPCGTCGMPFYTHVCLSCSPDDQTPGPGCINCRDTGMDQTPCMPNPAEQPQASPPPAT